MKMFTYGEYVDICNGIRIACFKAVSQHSSWEVQEEIENFWSAVTWLLF